MSTCAIRPSRLRVLALAGLAFLTTSGLSAQTQVFFFPANFQGRGSVAELPNGSPADPICSRDLRGLDLARVAIGLTGCGATEPRQPSLADRVDVLLLFDDLRGIPAPLIQVVPERFRQTVGGRLRVRPGATYGRDPDQNVRRTLFVGASGFHNAASSDAWIDQVRSLAASFDAGDARQTEREIHDFQIPYRSDYAAFQREVERRLCPIMLCDSDRGRKMREHIARHEDLRSLHRGYGSSGATEGQEVGVRAILDRQRDREDRILDLRFAQVGTERSFGGDTVRGEGPDPGPVIDRAVQEMDDAMGPLPEAEHGDELYAVGLPYRAFIEGYGSTLETLLRMHTSEMDEELLPRREPRTVNGCGAPPLHDRNRAGCRAALRFWRGLTPGQRRLLRLPPNMGPTLDRLRRRDCDVTHHFCPTCACEEQF